MTSSASAADAEAEASNTMASDVPADEEGQQSSHRDQSREHSHYRSDHEDAEYARSRRSKFRFKSSSGRSHKHSSRRSASPDSRDERDRHRHRHHHRSKRRKYSEPPEEQPDPSTQLDPDALFRESLFDAMADDEGAQFWEGVYGQPIPAIDPVKKTLTGELEAMTEEEYAAHVRAEMYKKTHQHLLEEKERRDKAKQEAAKRTAEARKEEIEAEKFRRQVEDSLKRGRERKDRVERAKGWQQRWTDYLELWEKFKTATEGSQKLPWPVWSGKRDDISKDEIETFFLNGPTSGNPDQADLLKTLKIERVRWHPDKIQQKLGHGMEEARLRAVTAVFQIIDRMWTEMKK
jgi:hypothetical protein